MVGCIIEDFLKDGSSSKVEGSDYDYNLLMIEYMIYHNLTTLRVPFSVRSYCYNLPST